MAWSSQLIPVTNQVLAKFDDGKAAIVLVQAGKGSLYYLAAPLKSADYHVFLVTSCTKLGIKRPVKAVDTDGNLITGAEVRSVERERDILVYASNLTADPIEFDLKAAKEINSVLDLRSLKEIKGCHIKLAPWQETIFRVEK